METNLTVQGLALLFAMLMGIALGFLYDLMFPIRQETKTSCQTVFEVIYALIAGAAAFFYALAAPGGRLGVWELTATLLGYLLYLHLFSKTILPLIQGVYGYACSGWEAGKRILKKFHEMTKMLFQCVRK